jgi:hypothetical protein
VNHPADASFFLDMEAAVRLPFALET